MPGHLYHTNEILILLGDNWFVERSARDAVAIAERRKQQVIKLLEEEKTQLDDWQKRLEFTSDMEGPLKEQDGMVEIREEYVDGEVEQRKKRIEHTRDQSRAKAHPPLRVSFDTPKAATKAQVDEGLWKRLDELEKEEEMEKKEEIETKKQETDHGKKGQGAKDSITANVGTSVATTECACTVAEKSPCGYPSTSSSTAVRDSQKEQTAPATLRLLFSHSSHTAEVEQPHARLEHEHNEVPEDNTDSTCKVMFSSPADIFRSKDVADIAEKEELTANKISARKSVSWDAALESHHSIGHSKPTIQQQTATAFSGQVMERATPSIAEPTMDPTRKVSRFKASRQK